MLVGISALAGIIQYFAGNDSFGFLFSENYERSPVKGYSDNLNLIYLNLILESIKIGKNNQKTDWLKRKNSNSPSKAITDILKIILLSSAEKHNISPLLIANKEDINQIALGFKNVKALKGWRYEIFGSIALKLMQGDISIKIKNGTIIID